MPTIKSIQPEKSIQITFVDWFKRQYPNYSGNIIRIANDNAHKGYGMKMGLCSGASDIFIAVMKGGYAGFWLEIKKDKFKVTPSNKKHYYQQMEFINRMIESGYYAAMCTGLDACIYVTKTYMNS
jgi:hypothetical protein